MSDRVASREPYALVGEGMIQEAFKTTDAGRASDDAQVKAYGQHAWNRVTLLKQPIKCIDAIPHKVIGKDEATLTLEAHVVGVKGVG